MNEEAFQDSASKGDRANLLLHEPLIAKFFEETEEKLLSGIKGSEFGDKEGRENLYQVYRLLISFKQFFERSIAEGKIASSMLEKLKAGAFDNM